MGKDIVLLHGCCHNPTGMDLEPAQWREVAGILASRRLLPFVDFAYQGFATGLEEDAHPVKVLFERVPEMIVSSSCSKNFGLYRDRVGSLSLLSDSAETAVRVRSQAMNIVRTMYSMPPDHGAAIVSRILGDDALRAEWIDEVDAMRARLKEMRALLGGALRDKAPGHDFSHIERANGMFSFLGITAGQVEQLKKDYGVYMVDSSRINVAGITRENVGYLADSIAAEQSLVFGKSLFARTSAQFDPADVLALVDTHAADLLVVVPTMLQRLCALPPRELARYETRTLRADFEDGDRQRLREMLSDPDVSDDREFPVRVASLGTRKITTDRDVPDNTQLIAEMPSGLTIMIIGSTVNEQGLGQVSALTDGAQGNGEGDAAPERGHQDDLRRPCPDHHGRNRQPPGGELEAMSERADPSQPGDLAEAVASALRTLRRRPGTGTPGRCWRRWCSRGKREGWPIIFSLARISAIRVMLLPDGITIVLFCSNGPGSVII